MQHVDPYNDDFFKKAADDYPLRTDAGNWEDVAGKLNSFTQEEIVTKANYRNIRQKSAMVCALLLIPFAIAVTKYWNVNYGQLPEMPVKDKESGPTTKITKANGAKKEIYNAGLIEEVKGINFNPDEEKQNVLRNSALEDKIEKQKGASNSSIEKNVEHSNANDLIAKDDKQVSNDAKENVSFQKDADKKNVELNTSKYKGFYIGGAIAPELTSVKLQPARKSFDIGLLVGYNLNKNLSIELGFMLAQKYYYSSGKYVVPNSIGPEGSKIITVNAFNSITELPLTVQYNLKNENSSRFFVSAGAVSYIIHKENYSYTYSENGQEKQGKTLSNKASQNWFSNVQMSIGYEHSFSKICDVRIEPYCRIPIKGIGISDLPVFSGGVTLALIKTIK